MAGSFSFTPVVGGDRPRSTGEGTSSGTHGVTKGDVMGLSFGLWSGDERSSVAVRLFVGSSQWASPAAPIFMYAFVGAPLTSTWTIFSLDRTTLSFPKRTLNGLHLSVPSGCSMTIMSLAPLDTSRLLNV